MANHPTPTTKNAALYDVAIIGAGAAGWYAIAHLLRGKPDLKILVLEASQKSLAKLRISGGGRCNVTHKPHAIKEFAQNYARGEKAMFAALHHHSAVDVLDFFGDDGIRIVAESDGRMFPHTNSSETIARSLERPWRESRVEVKFGQRVKKLENQGNNWLLNAPEEDFFAKTVLLCAGGLTQATVGEPLFGLPIPLINAVPSLFSFRSDSLKNGQLPGVSLVNAKLSSGKSQASGPLMFTHEGISGPAALRLSAFGARKFAEEGYRAFLTLSIQGQNANGWTAELLQVIKNHSRKNVSTRVMEAVPARLWEYITSVSVPTPKNYADLSKKELSAIANHLGNWIIPTQGKSTNKDEFVTAGGIDLKAVDFRMMQLKSFAGLFAAGEILDIDGVTGGFNFQAAWTTGYLASQGILSYLNEA